MFPSALGSRGDYRLSAEIENCVVKMLGIIGQVGNDAARLQPLQEVCAIEHIATMAGPQDKANRQAKRIDRGVDFRA